MTTTTPSTTELDGLLDLVLAAPLWTAEPTADRLAMTLALDPSAARPNDLFEEAKRNGWDDFRTAGAWLYDRECHAAVRRRADDVTFHVQRITVLLGRCVALPDNTANKIRDLLRDGLLRNATRDALVSILLAAGASTAAPAITMLDENDDQQPTKSKAKKEPEQLDRHDVQILRACYERRVDQQEIAKESGVSWGNVKKRTAGLQDAGWLECDHEEGGWLRTREGTRELERRGLLNPTSAELRELKNGKARGFSSK